MAVPVVETVESDVELPAAVDVAIIGGGIAGLTTAMELLERGLSVGVFEKGVIAGEQSGRNWGWCRKMGRDSREVPLSKISLDLWAAMDKRIGGETGFTRCGIAYLCQTPKQMASREKWHAEQAVPNGLSTHLFGAAEAKELAPNSSVEWAGGLITPDDGRAEPQKAVPAMARYIRAQGGQIFQNCAVRDIEKSAGAVSGIITERGTVACKNVVLAGGAWSRRFAHNIGVRLPQIMVQNNVFATTPVRSQLQTSVAGGGVAVRRRADGGFTIGDDTYNTADFLPDYIRLAGAFLPTLRDNWRDFRFRIGPRFLEEAKLKRRWKPDEVSPFEQVRVLDPAPQKKINEKSFETLRRIHPEFREAKISHQWAGAIDVVPDVVPVISDVSAIPGFFMLTGLSGHGFGLGPGAGKLMAELLTNETPCVDPTPFRLDRF
ncbi:NAD(P)/FAD-dependent oxidoreductase [Pseudahrensia aquimaris]|uniref:NAD(P)/FAD-dependent oxidoreductase n=1 Tax=Pseudahrensia aquimaris TaxID=744461 RepID=A0ABW3FBS3_9HYPH